MMTFVLQSTADALNESDQNSFVEHEDILLDDEQRLEYFGKFYAKQPDKFRFHPGDRILIKELVAFVERVVKEKGLHVFKQTKTAKTAAKNTTQKVIKKSIKPKRQPKISTPNSSSIEMNIDELKSNLMHRLKVCLYSYRVNHAFDLDLENDIHEDTIQVKITNGDINGTIRCIICDKQNRSKNGPKHIHYSSGSDYPCWVLANFTTHLKRQHKLEKHKLHTDLTDVIGVSSSDRNDVMSDQKPDESVVCLNSST